HDLRRPHQHRHPRAHHGPAPAVGRHETHLLAGAAMTTPKIHFDQVSATFDLNGKPFTAVDRVDLTIGDNEFVTVVGPSGCGKSTLMNMAGGLLAPSSGRVLVDGEEVSG